MFENSRFIRLLPKIRTVRGIYLENKQLVVTAAFLAMIVVSVVGAMLGFYAYSREPYIEVEKPLYRYVRESAYSIQIALKPNRVYGTQTLQLEEGKTLPIYLNLVDNISISYSFSVENANTTGTLQLLVLLKHPHGWSVKYIELMDDFANKASQTLSIDLDEAIAYMEDLCREVGLKLTVFNISIVSFFSGKVRVGSVTRSDSFVHGVSLLADLSRNRIEFSGPLSQKAPVEEKRTVYIQQTIFGIGVDMLRIASPIITSVGAVATAVLAIVRLRISPRDPVKDFESKYRALIVSASHVQGAGNRVVKVSSPEEIVKTSRLLEKPIIKHVEAGGGNPGKVAYMVIDRDATYVYELNTQ